MNSTEKRQTIQKDGYQDRVRREHDELNIKINRLEAFIAGSVFDTLPPEEQERLEKQEYHMRNYCLMLIERIDWFNTL